MNTLRPVFHNHETPRRWLRDAVLFIGIFIFVLWALARLATWIFIILDVNK